MQFPRQSSIHSHNYKKKEDRKNNITRKKKGQKVEEILMRVSLKDARCVGHARTSDLRGEFECLVAKIRMTEGNVEGERSAKSRAEFALPTDDRRARFKAEAFLVVEKKNYAACG